MELITALYHYTIYASTQQARKALSWVYRASTTDELIERLHQINEQAWGAFMQQSKTLPGVEEIIDACTELLNMEP